MSDLLKEAIADAKAVRETALLNAKMALEEAFTPHLKSMLSAKLAEDEEDYEDDEEVPVSDDEEDAEDMARYHREEDDEVPVDVGDDDEEEIEIEPEEEGLGYDESEIIEIDGVKYAPIVAEEDADEDYGENEDLDLEAVIRELEQEIAEADDETVSEEDEVISEEDDDDDEEDDDDEKEMKEQSSSSGIGKGTGVKQASAADEEDPGKGKVHEQVEQLQSELNEYKEAIAYLRDKLHEVNILNAKLLYTNRLFREFGLSNDQKLKIVETFDRAQTTREIKLVYSTLAESFKDGGFIVKKSTVKESASRKTGTTAPRRKIITEEDQVARRFQKLAGILKD